MNHCRCGSLRAMPLSSGTQLKAAPSEVLFRAMPCIGCDWSWPYSLGLAVCHDKRPRTQSTRLPQVTYTKKKSKQGGSREGNEELSGLSQNGHASVEVDRRRSRDDKNVMG